MSAQRANTTATTKHIWCVLTLLDLTHVTARLATNWRMGSFVEVNQRYRALFMDAMTTSNNIIADIDECENSSICEHFCINNDGSFNCECRANYTKTLDHRGCLGKIWHAMDVLYYVLVYSLSVMSEPLCVHGTHNALYSSS